MTTSCNGAARTARMHRTRTKIFAEMGEYINKLSQALLQRATTSIANNMASGGTTA